MDNRPIGVFDSGLGGLTVVRQLKSLLGNEHIIYFGDTGRVPYGTKSVETVCRYTRQDEAFLLSYGVKMVIVACGTASSVAKSVTKELPVPFVSVVSPTAVAAASATKNGKIGVIGTVATVNSGSFRNELKNINQKFEIYEEACSLFVPLVEAGWVTDTDEVTVKTAERYLLPLKEKGIDTLILGCTHFPIISNIIQKVMGEDVTLISSGAEAAKAAASFLKDNDMLREGNGKEEYFVSDDAHSFAGTAEIFLGHSIKNEVFRVNIEEY